MGKMATESFFEDMVIDTPEAAANLEALIASGVKWKRGDTVFTYGDVNSEWIRKAIENNSRKQ